MLATRMLAVAIIRISERSKLLKTRNIGTLTVPEHPIVIVVQPKRKRYGGGKRRAGITVKAQRQSHKQALAST